MRIAVNTQHLLNGKLEGIGWFAHETLKRIIPAHPEHEFIFIFDRPWDDRFIYSDNVTPVATKIPSRHPFLWYWHYEIDVPKILKKHNADIFYSPDGWMSLNTEVPTVNAIHDINFIHRPQDFPFITRKYYNRYFPRFAQKANRLITVSEYSKRDLVKTFNIDPKKIDVSYNGCNESFVPVDEDVKVEVRNRFSKGFRYFVYIGSVNPRKNIEGLLMGFDRFKKMIKSDYKLLIVGENMWNSYTISETLRSMSNNNEVIFTGRLSTQVLHLVLASAEAQCLVSFSEGFGIPVLEAMYCDVPVICSNVASLPEVAGDAAVYVDPFSHESIAEAFFKISSDECYRDMLIERGKNQRTKFSWKNSANMVWSSIEKTL